MSKIEKNHGKPLANNPTNIAITSHQGPLPSPDVLEKYADIDSSFPERIMKMAEKEQDSRLKENLIILENNKNLQMEQYKLIKNNSFLGSLLLILSMIGCIGSAYLKFNYFISLAFLAMPIASVISDIIKNPTKQ